MILPYTTIMHLTTQCIPYTVEFQLYHFLFLRQPYKVLVILVLLMDRAALIRLHIVYGCFHVVMQSWVVITENMVHKAENILISGHLRNKNA